MANCLDCQRCINGSTPVCNLDDKVFPIDNTNQAETCTNFEAKPLLLKKHKEKPTPESQKPESKVSFKSGVGWILSAFLGGILVTIIVTGVIRG